MISVILKEKKYKAGFQYAISFALIAGITLLSYFSVGYIGYRVVALILLLAVSILAMIFDIVPVLITAIFSALVWNFFFIPPTFTFHISTPEDALMSLMYLAIALINAVLTFKIRDFEKKARDREEKEKTIKLYNTLLNSLSHELRTPISTIIGAIDTIKEQVDKLSDKHKFELYTEIEIAGLRLNRQVQNLLNMSRLEAGVLQPKLDWCDMAELIKSIILGNQKEAVNHHIEFHPKENESLYKVDRGLIETIIYNILHNAILYTPKSSTIRIELSQERGSCVVVISDNGKGFPENELGFVFDKFYRLPQTLPGGTGLGLSIVKGFAEAHNGTIALENIKTGGAKFTLRIPAEGYSI